MAQFKKGNPGKPKGAANKVTKGIRQRFEQLLDAVTVEQMAEDLKALKPAERLNVIMGLAEFITPKLARTQMQHEGNAANPIVWHEVRTYEAGTEQPNPLKYFPTAEA